MRDVVISRRESSNVSLYDLSVVAQKKGVIEVGSSLDGDAPPAKVVVSRGVLTEKVIFAVPFIVNIGEHVPSMAPISSIVKSI